MTLPKCTNNEYNIGIIIPPLVLTIPCGLSLLCMLSLIIFILNQPLITNKRYWKHFITYPINLNIYRPFIVDKTYTLIKLLFKKKRNQGKKIIPNSSS